MSLPLLYSKDLLSVDARTLQAYLQAGYLTSETLIYSILAQIDRYDQQGLQLRAMLAVTPLSVLLDRARQLDRERQAGKLRSALHGIPITLKDCIATHPVLGLPTSIGSLALYDSIVSHSASIVDHLTEAGLIIIGKTNLGECCGMKGDAHPPGWSRVGGQTRSPYDQGIFQLESNLASPAGSSTGSAVSVAAGYAPLSIGAETMGSIIHPADRAALYGLKPTIGKIKGDHTWMVSASCDALGPMAKSVDDLLMLYNILVDAKLSIKQSLSSLSKTASCLNVGFLDIETWPYSIGEADANVKQQVKETLATVMQIMKKQVGRVVSPIELPLPSQLIKNGESALNTVLYYEYSTHINHYLQSLTYSKVRTLEALIDWNEQFDIEGKNLDQNRLKKALYERPSQHDYQNARLHMRTLYREHGIDQAIKKYQLDVIAAPALSRICEVASASGYPIATMPLDRLENNGMPFGLALISTAHREDVLFALMKATENLFGKRKMPEILM